MSSRIAIASSLIALAACGRAPSSTLREDAYVWQRQWTPAVVDAVGAARFDALRVLALDVSRDGNSEIAFEASALQGHRVIPVLRIEGSGAIDGATLVDDAAAELARFRGLQVVALEIDHDCAAGKLASYAASLRALKASLSVPLQITALPSWAPSPALDDVMDAVDAVTLQVHAVDRPDAGLFSRSRARAAIDAFAKRARAPFFVALPTYGSALSATGAVESESPRTDQAPDRRALWADPQQVTSLLRSLDDDRPRHLAGIAWFRLPNRDDARAWSAGTLAAVRSRSVHPHFSIERDGVDVFARNDGDVDGMAPARVPLDQVTAADGAHGYRFDGRALTSSTPPWVRVGERVPVGWARTATTKTTNSEAAR